MTQQQHERRPLPRWRIAGVLLELGKGQGRLLSHKDQPWSSATFRGVRHAVALQFTGQSGVDAGEALIAALPDHQFLFSGWLVAEVVIRQVTFLAGTSPELTVNVEILLLEDQ